MVLGYNGSMENLCLSCKTPIIQKNKGRPSKFCSKGCNQAYAPMYDKLKEKKCKFCKELFMNTRKNTSYCSIDCRQKHNELNRISVQLICAECKESFTAKKKDAKYCSKKCKNTNPKLYNHMCAWCWKPFESTNSKQTFCSTTCSGYNQRETRRNSNVFNLPERIYTSKKRRDWYIARKRISANWVEYVDIKVLIERDKGICQICFKSVNLDVPYYHKEAPTKDHIIAKALGGAHSYANCQLAHRSCNSKKHTRTEVKQNATTKQKRQSNSPEVTN